MRIKAAFVVAAALAATIAAMLPIPKDPDSGAVHALAAPLPDLRG